MWRRPPSLHPSELGIAWGLEPFVRGMQVFGKFVAGSQPGKYDFGLFGLQTRIGSQLFRKVEDFDGRPEFGKQDGGTCVQPRGGEYEVDRFGQRNEITTSVRMRDRYGFTARDLLLEQRYHAPGRTENIRQ